MAVWKVWNYKTYAIYVIDRLCLTYKTRGNLNYQSDTTTEDKAPSCASH